MGRVSSKRVRGLLDFNDAVDLCIWQVAEDYVEYDGCIYPFPPTGWPKYTRDRPLADPNLFLSFSRLGARGDDLPGNAILRWVRKHGLLRLKDPEGYPTRNENQSPITLDEFRREARYAHQAMTLFEAIHSKDSAALRPRVTRVRDDPSGKPGEGRNADVYLDGERIPMSTAADGELPDDLVLLAAEMGLQWFVKRRLVDVRLDFDPFGGHPRAGQAYRPRLVFRIPDLYSAIWYQFALLLADARPVKFCEICERPIFHPRRDQKTCSDACRKEKSRRKKAGQTSSCSGQHDR